jgi:exodeoxyribonuclease VII small subunit
LTDALKTEAAPKFEDALKELEEVVARLEKGELSLEESLRLYERGIALARHCHGKLEEAEGRIEMLLKDARGGVALDAKGQPRTKPFVQDEPE